MKKKLIVLLVEDNPCDENILTVLLEKEFDLQLTRVETEDEYRNELGSISPDIILCDYTLPSFDGLSALKIKQKLFPQLPFIIVTGSNNEEIAVECMKAGADDYVLKENTNRLIPAINSAITKAKNWMLQHETLSQLNISEDKYRYLFYNHPHPMWIYDVDTLKFIEVNDSAIENYGYTRDEFKNLTLKDIRPEEDIPILIENIRTKASVIQHKRSFRHKKKDGTIIIAEISSHKLPAKNNENLRLVMAIDITENKQAEEKLKETYSLLKIATEKAKLGGWNVNLEENRVYWSDEVAAIHEMPAGYNPLVEDGINFYAPQWRDKITKVFTDCAQKGIPYDEEMEIITATGKRKWVRTIGEPVRDETGNIFKVQGAFQDITEKKRTEEALRNSEQQYRTLFENMNAGFVLFEVVQNEQNIPVDLIIIAANEGFEKTTGLNLKNCIGKYLTQVLPGIEKDEADWIGTFSRVALFGESVQFEQGSELLGFYYSVSAYKAAPKQCAVTFIDITKRKLAEKALRMSEERLRLSTELANVAVWEYDFNTNSMSRSKNHDKLYGLEWQTHWDLNTFTNATHQDDREYSNKIIQEAVAPGGPDKYTFDFRVVYPDQSIHWLNVVGQVLERDSNKVGIIVRGCLIDITDRKQAEDELNRHRNILQLFVKHAPAAIAMFDDKMKYLAYSDRYLEDYNLRDKNLVGLSHYEVFPEIPQRWIDIHNNCLAGSIERNEEDKFARADGSFDWVRWEIHPWYERNDKIGGILLFSEVITEQKEAKDNLKQLMNRLIESEELFRKKASQQLHDEVGQNLTALTINLNYISTQLPKEVDQKVTRRLKDSLSILDETIEQIRNVMVELRPSVLDDYGLFAAMKWSLNLFKERTNINATIKGKALSNRLPINIEYAIFRSVQEILHNIAKHADAANVFIDFEESSSGVKLTITDDGVGFDTTVNKKPSGFGLQSISERMKLIDAKLSLISKPGAGTTVIFEIQR
ncbi:MAG TPA: PAS domain S-box protein [Ignavibacteria bacterium]|nr:PAS domain S-box protein [Ignavibacteria bacterium]